MGEIYGIFSKKHNKIVYVGQTSEGYKKRFKRHLRCSKDNENRTALYNSIRKYGVDNFSTICLYECDNDLLNDNEKEYIEKYDTYKNGYNETVGGDGQRGYKHKQSTKDTIGQKLKLRWESDRDSIMESLMKRPPRKQTEEELRWRSDYMKEHNPSKNEKTRKKISEAAKERYKTQRPPNAFNWRIITPSGQEIVTNKLKDYCKENNLGYSGIYRAYRLNISYQGYKLYKVTNEED